MTAMDVFAGVCLVLVGWTGYELGGASERERAARRAERAAERAAASLPVVDEVAARRRAHRTAS